jgi:hypothetical protein
MAADGHVFDHMRAALDNTMAEPWRLVAPPFHCDAPQRRAHPRGIRPRALEPFHRLVDHLADRGAENAPNSTSGAQANQVHDRFNRLTKSVTGQITAVAMMAMREAENHEIARLAASPAILRPRSRS